MNPRVIAQNDREISRVQLKQIRPPKATKTWQPVEHYELVLKMEEALQRHNLSIAKEEIAIARGGGFLFYVADVERGHGAKLLKTKGYTASIGIMSSNNKRIAIQVSVGARVTVCDNLLFSGDTLTLRKKHSHSLKIAEELDKTVLGFIEAFDSLASEIEVMKEKEIADQEAMSIILPAFTVERVLPIRLIYKVCQEYFNPTHKEFKGRNLWSLQNAFTIAATDLSPGRKFSSLKILGRIFTNLIKKQ